MLSLRILRDFPPQISIKRGWGQIWSSGRFGKPQILGFSGIFHSKNPSKTGSGMGLWDLGLGFWDKGDFGDFWDPGCSRRSWSGRNTRRSSGNSGNASRPLGKIWIKLGAAPPIPKSWRRSGRWEKSRIFSPKIQDIFPQIWDFFPKFWDCFPTSLPSQELREAREELEKERELRGSLRDEVSNQELELERLRKDLEKLQEERDEAARVRGGNREGILGNREFGALGVLVVGSAQTVPKKIP